jgi:hypothetical protein
MATLAAQAAYRSQERNFFTGMALVMLLTVLVGFAPTYYLFPWFQGVTTRGVAGGASLSPLVHLHAILFSAWILLFLAQVSFIRLEHFDLHRAFGTGGVLLAAAMVVVGLWTAIDSARNASTPPGWPNAEVFLIVPFTSIALFVGFVSAAILNRHRPDYHKRLMLLGAMALLLPALSRIVRMAELSFLPFGARGGLVILNFFVATLVIFDLYSRHRLHPVTAWGVVIYLVAWPARLTVGYTEPWQGFARSLLN